MIWKSILPESVLKMLILEICLYISFSLLTGHHREEAIAPRKEAV